MAGVNSCHFVGFLGKDPELRYTASNQAVANFSVACNETWKDANGDKKERVEWVRCQAWGKLAEIVGEFLHKGSQVYISGRMQTRKYEKDGSDRYTTEIVVSEMKMLGGKSEGGYQPKDEDAPPESRRAAQAPDTRQPAQQATLVDDGFDDSIPF
jgi:single-strand DNA-binding protein